MRVVREHAGLSERRACGLIGMHRGSWRYRRKERNEAALRARLRELAGERPRFGYRRLYIFLRREKTEDGTPRWRVNHTRVYRLYREEGLAMQRKRRKRFRAEARVPLALPTRANEMWTMDYTHDPNGRRAEIPNAESDGWLHARGCGPSYSRGSLKSLLRKNITWYGDTKASKQPIIPIKIAASPGMIFSRHP